MQPCTAPYSRVLPCVALCSPVQLNETTHLQAPSTLSTLNVLAVVLQDPLCPRIPCARTTPDPSYPLARPRYPPSDPFCLTTAIPSAPPLHFLLSHPPATPMSHPACALDAACHACHSGWGHAHTDLFSGARETS